MTSSQRPRQEHLSTIRMITVWATTVTILNGSFITMAIAAPAKLDAIAPPPHSPFPLETQPQIFTDGFSAALKSDNYSSYGDGNSKDGDKGDGGFIKSQLPSAIDSYGNPIETLKPIDTPDGRKVISAQGLQFEIPNYASGITEIKKPSDDLLPPFIDPIAVAAPNDSGNDTSVTGVETNVYTAATGITTDVDAEKWDRASTSQGGIRRKTSPNSLPQYILELNDPDIGGPVEYMPIEEGSSLKVIAWDLLPPVEQDPKISIGENSRPKEANDIKKQSYVTSIETSSVIPPTNSYRGHVHYTSPTVTSSISTTVFVKTPTTPKAVTTILGIPTRATTIRPLATTTTHRATMKTTHHTTATGRTTTTSTTLAPINGSDFYQLEHGDSYTIPSWLADIDDPELDAAVTYIVPENINEYNDTISLDLLPPLEPYADLNNIDLPAPSAMPSTTIASFTSATSPLTSLTPITSRTSTPRPTAPTPRPNWVHAHQPTLSSVTTTTTQPNIFDDRFSSNNIVQHPHSKITSSSTPQNTKVNTLGIPTKAPLSRLTTPAHQINSQNVPNYTADLINSTDAESIKEEVDGKFQVSNSNPFLSTQITTTSPFISVASTSTTIPVTPFDENPFVSATLPPWLADFDYPDLAPGVPFTHNVENSKSDVFNDLLPPSQLNTQASETTKPVFITSSTTSFNSFPASFNSVHRDDPTLASASTSATHTFAYNTFPLKVTTTTKPFSIQKLFVQRPNNSDDTNKKSQEEAVMLTNALFDPPIAPGNDINHANPQTDNVNFNTPPQQKQKQHSQLQPAASADQIKKIPSSSNFNTNFAAPFETVTSKNTDAAISVDAEISSSTKTTFTKSNEGKVITNNIFGASNSATTPLKQLGLSTSTTAGQTTSQKGSHHNSANHFQSNISSFSDSSSSPSGFSTFSRTQQLSNFGGFKSTAVESHATSVSGGKYTGSFGGSPGVLGNGKLGYAVQTNGFIRPPPNEQAAIPALLNFPTIPSFANRAGAPVGLNKFQGTFGGPPGVLIPFDNGKSE